MLEVTCDTKVEAEQHDGGPADADDREVGLSFGDECCCQWYE